MSEYIRIHREGQHAKWPHPSSNAEPKPEESIPGNHIDVGATVPAERPNLTGGRHVVNEESHRATAASRLDVHIKNSVLLPEKSGINTHTRSCPVGAVFDQ